MFLLILSYIGGFLTILSPCILPVLPFVFAKSDQSFLKGGLPLLAGMALTFAGVSLLAVAGGNWVVSATQWGRWGALVLLSLFALSLIFPHYLETLMAPLTNWGVKLGHRQENPSVRSSLLIGVATGFLWAPCAGPILGLILTGAATQKSPLEAASFLLAYALGAGSSLALALVAGGKFFGRLKKYLKAEAGVKKVLGVAVLLGVAAIALNLDRSVLTKISRLQTENIEQSLLQNFKTDAGAMKDEGRLPSLDGAVAWLNSPPLTAEALKGKVVLVDFWTYSCINCLRTLPYVKAWAAKYKDAGLVVIGVHTPEFAFEKDSGNVAAAVKDLRIEYPVAVDSNYKIWNAFQNEYWPAHYFIDREGNIRHHHFGEGHYEESEKVIQELLGEKSGSGFVKVEAHGAEVSGALDSRRSPETYIGYSRATGLQSLPAVNKDRDQAYTLVTPLAANEWSLSGEWRMGPQQATLVAGAGKITYHFHARDLHLVLGPLKPGQSVPFRVRLDGHAPAENHGTDIDAAGNGRVQDYRLYQLIRQKESTPQQDHYFEIEFLEPNVQAFAFTFG